MSFTQEDTTGGGACPGNLVYCSGRADSANTGQQRLCEIGGTAGTGTMQFSIASSETNVNIGNFTCLLPVGTVGDSGTWTVRLNVTTANMNVTVTEIHICRVDSGCTNQETIGSATGLSISLGSTGVKTQTVSGAAVTVNANDEVVCVLIASNGAMSTQTGNFTPNQNIDSPFTQVTQSLLWDRLSPMRPHLVRKAREFFLGGLPPKLAKLRMVQNAAGLFVPSNDPEFARERVQLRKAA